MQINDLINARQRHLEAAYPIKDLPVMAKFYNNHISEAKKLQQQIKNLLCEERIQKAEKEKLSHVVVKHTSPKP